MGARCKKEDRIEEKKNWNRFDPASICSLPRLFALFSVFVGVFRTNGADCRVPI